MMTRPEAIKRVEQALHLHLSPEQLSIVQNTENRPKLVISCAGSGKTTLLLFNILVSILTGEEKSSNILGITFSKRAQLDMVHKYKHDVALLNKAGIFLHTTQLPTFRTFDAMFLHLLKHFREYRHARVLPSYTRVSYKLYPAFKKRPKAMSMKDELKSIFEFRGFLIQSHLTRDGYHLLKVKNDPITLGMIADQMGLHYPVDFFANYFSIAKRYIMIKKRRGLIDFDDMKFKLMNKVSNTKTHAVVLGLMNQYHLCFIDEFQDIDPLDWILIQKVLSKTAKQKLTVIGDDDQSIYAFRGSDPRIILNYKKHYPKTKVFKLSTNYRTNGKVLNTVRPLIENNKFRMIKQLRSNHSVAGGAYEFCDNKIESGGNLLLNKIWRMHLSKSIPDKDIAILVRYNSDKALATDWFANHKLYLKSDFNFQQTYIYKILVGMMHALAYDNIKMMFPYLHVIGFSKYVTHIKRYLKMYTEPAMSLAGFLTSLCEYERRHGQQHRKASKLDKKLLNTDKFFHQKLDISANAAFHKVVSLTDNYFHYMSHDNNFMSSDVIGDYINYLNWETSKFTTLSDFLKFERIKAYNIKYHSSKQNAQFPIMTLHQSKGLQFKYVFLYNLTDRDVSLRMQKENKYFAPNITKLQLLMKLYHMTYAQASDADAEDDVASNDEATPCSDLKTTLATIASAMRYDAKHKDKKHYRTLAKTLFKQCLDKLAKNTYTTTKQNQEVQNDVNDTYLEVRNNSNIVEEERRLIYVGMTRAESSVVFNFSVDSNPLLTELKIPKSNIMAADKYKRAMPVATAAKEAKVSALEAQMRHMKKEKAELLSSLHDKN